MKIFLIYKILSNFLCVPTKAFVMFCVFLFIKGEKKEKELMIVKLKLQKDGLKNHKDQLKRLINAVEEDREDNRQKLQLRENKIENEPSPEKQQELLREKDNLLQAVWKLEQIKKDFDTLLLHIDEMLELLESDCTDKHG